MGKRQEAAKQTRAAIVEAAAQLQGDKGLSDVSIDDIVSKAGVSKGSFYTYFKRKEDVAMEIGMVGFTRIKEQLPPMSHGPVERIGQYLVGSVDLIVAEGIESCKDWMKAAVSPVTADSVAMHKFNFDRSFIVEELEHGTQLNPERIQSIADLVMAEYYGLVALWSITDGAFPIQQRMRDFVERIIHYGNYDIK